MVSFNLKPFALSLSKGRTLLLALRSKEERCFDKLSTNGTRVIHVMRTLPQTAALSAKPHACRASGAMRAEAASALAFDALPSIARFLIPWMIPTSRNRL